MNRLLKFFLLFVGMAGTGISCEKCAKKETKKPTKDTAAHYNYAVGLDNVGNTCFMNAPLQALTAIPELTKYFISGRYAQDINASSPYQGEISRAFGKLVKDMRLNQQAKSINPRDFVEKIQKTSFFL